VAGLEASGEGVTLPLFDSVAPDLRREIDAELSKPWSRYRPEDITSARHRGAETSEEAHERIAPHKTAMQNRVLDFLRSVGRTGATTDEVSRALEIAYTSASARMSELKADGRAVATDRRRRTVFGSPAAVIVASDFAPVPGSQHGMESTDDGSHDAECLSSASQVSRLPSTEGK
jgi:hypothetical protein